MPPRSLVPLLALLAVLCGCGASHAAPAPARQADPAPSPAAASSAAASACKPARGDSYLGNALLHVPPRVRALLPPVVAFHGARGDGDRFAVESGLSRSS